MPHLGPEIAKALRPLEERIAALEARVPNMGVQLPTTPKVHELCGWRWHDNKAIHVCFDVAHHLMEHRCHCAALYPS